MQGNIFTPGLLRKGEDLIVLDSSNQGGFFISVSAVPDCGTGMRKDPDSTLHLGSAFLSKRVGSWTRSRDFAPHNQ